MQKTLELKAQGPVSNRNPQWQPQAARVLLGLGGFVLRYGVVFFLLLFGAAKWTKAEAIGIEPMVAHSPLMFWIYRLADVQHGSELIGVVELSIALLMAARPFRPLWCAVGSLLAIPMFLTTLSFLFTTPGLDANSADAGFLTKDLILLGAVCWSAGEALQTVHRKTTAPKASSV